MTTHAFIFQPGYWIGEGQISFSASPEKLRFYTRWMASGMATEGIRCQQKVEMEGGEETVYNQFLFFHLRESAFQIQLENDLVELVVGKGVLDQKTIAWEFRGNGKIEGFEVYTLQENGDYLIHAEYSSPDLFRTLIDGRIWKKTP